MTEDLIPLTIPSSPCYLIHRVASKFDRERNNRHKKALNGPSGEADGPAPIIPDPFLWDDASECYVQSPKFDKYLGQQIKADLLVRVIEALRQKEFRVGRHVFGFHFDLSEFARRNGLDKNIQNLFNATQREAEGRLAIIRLRLQKKIKTTLEWEGKNQFQVVTLSKAQIEAVLKEFLPKAEERN